MGGKNKKINVKQARWLTLFQLGFVTLYIVTMIKSILALLSWNKVKKFRLVTVGLLGQITLMGFVHTVGPGKDENKKCKEFGSNVKGCTKELNASRQA